MAKIETICTAKMMHTSWLDPVQTVIESSGTGNSNLNLILGTQSDGTIQLLCERHTQATLKIRICQNSNALRGCAGRHDSWASVTGLQSAEVSLRVCTCMSQRQSILTRQSTLYTCVQCAQSHVHMQLVTLCRLPGPTCCKHRCGQCHRQRDPVHVPTSWQP